MLGNEFSWEESSSVNADKCGVVWMESLLCQGEIPNSELRSEIMQLMKYTSEESLQNIQLESSLAYVW